jgi:DNA-binding CsgD family transcriptional regulator
MGAQGLLERETELATLDRILRQAVDGRGGVVLVEGPAGAGKSALLGALVDRARADGLAILRAVGGELEREYPYGMVRQLFEIELRGAGPARRDQLLAGAAARAGPVLGLVTTDGESGLDSSFSTLHALYWLVVALSDESPLLLVLDDAHWADASSLRFVEFLARRVDELPVLVALGIRVNEPGADIALLDAIGDGDAVTTLVPPALSADAARTFIRDRLGDRAGDDVVDAAATSTAGNPLLLSELAGALARDPGRLTPEAVVAVVPSSVSRSVQRRLARLDPAARGVAEALATLGDRITEADLARVCGRTPTEVAAAVAFLRALGLLGGGDLRFVHPLVRQAAADGVAIPERHRLHGDFAHTLHDRGADPEEVIVQLLARPALGESWAREVLRAGGRRALAEGAPESAARRIARALQEGPEAADPEALLELGEATLRAGDPSGISHLVRAAEAADPVVSARAVLAIVQTESMSEDFDGERVAARLTAALARLGPDAPLELRDRITGVLMSASMLNHDLVAGHRRLLDAPEEPSLPALLSRRAYDGACGEMPRDRVRVLVARAIELAPFTRLSQIETGHAWWAIGALHLVDASDEADASLSEAETTARRHGSRLGRAWVLTVRSHFAVQFGSVAAGEASAREAIALWESLGFARLSVTALAQLVGALALRGDLEGAGRELARCADEAAPFTRAMVLIGRATLRMAERRATEAVADLREVQQLADVLGQRRFGWGHTGVELAAALLAAGEREEALVVADEELRVAELADRPTLRTRALTVRALAGPDEERLAGLGRAAQTPGPRCAPLARAEAQLEYGAALRRRGRSGEARPWLRDAAELATRTGARALGDRALEELVIAGGRPRSRYSSGLESLTPSERRVAEHAAAGLSNREIAETLFVTRKTVELHLGHAYGKLGIRSRAQLSSVLAPDPGRGSP